MTDISLFERAHRHRQEQASGVAFGRIIDVDAKKRLCTVATMMGAGSMNDQVLPNCMWVSTDLNPDGDESGSIPRRGTMGLVFFVDSATFFWGAFPPLGVEGSAAKPDSLLSLVEGDKVISTLTGNRLTIKRSGLIELYSSDLLQRLMFRTNSGVYRIQDICGDYILNVSDGGLISWSSDPATQVSLYRAEYRRDLAKSFLITEEKGNVTPDIISRTYIGPGVPGYPQVATPVYTNEITIAGQMTTTLSFPQFPGTPAGYASVIGPDGSISIKAGAFQTTTIDVGASGAVDLSVNSLATVSVSELGDISAKGPVASAEMSAAGEVTFKNAMATASLKVSGEIEITNVQGKIVINPAGQITIESSLGAVKIQATQIDLKSMGPINIESLGPTSVKSTGPLELTGLGMPATGSVLTNPQTLSPFTGAPLVPFSTSVKVSV